METAYTVGRRRATATVVAVMMVGLSACSSEQPEGRDGQAVAADVRTLQAAFAAGDMAALCRQMTKPAVRQAGGFVHGLPTLYCERDLRRAFKILRDGGGWRATRPAVSRISARSGRATATLAHRDGKWKADVPLTDSGGRWKLAGFFGADVAEVAAIEKSSQARPFPAPRGEAVEVADVDGRACSDLSDSEYPQITGGCSFTVSDRTVPVRMLTPFGEVDFGNCAISYRVSVDASGRTWTDRWEATTHAACSDIDPCKEGSFDYHPWKGRLVKDGRGGYLHHMDMCLRTCIGTFVGDLVMRMVRDQKGWRVEPTDQGASGFRFDGPLAVRGKQIDVQG
jgi:hypothetical protein